jgi:hypothetical protein
MSILTLEHDWEEFGLAPKRIARNRLVEGFVDSLGDPDSARGASLVRSSASAGKPPSAFSETSQEDAANYARVMLGAASSGNMGTVVNYLDAGYPITSINPVLCQTMLHILAGKKEPRNLAFLLSHEQFSEAPTAGKTQILEARDNRGNTPIMAAAGSGRPDSIALLANEGANPDACNNEGKTPLVLAVFAEENSSEAVSALLDAGANPTLKDKGLTMEDYNSTLEDGDSPMNEDECVKIGKIPYVDPPRSAAEYARLLKYNSLAEKLEAAERKWKAAAQSAKDGRKK